MIDHHAGLGKSNSDADICNREGPVSRALFEPHPTHQRQLSVSMRVVIAPMTGSLCIGINPVETYKRAGTYAKHLLPSLPFTPGADGAGMVEAIGNGVSSVAVGDRVWLSGSVSGHHKPL